MRGLLLKDWYCSLKFCKMFFLMDIVFFAVALIGTKNFFFLCFPCLVTAFFPMTLIGCDEQDGWERYAGTLPYTRGQLVSSKYIIGLVHGLVMVVLAAGIGTYQNASSGVSALKIFLSLLAVFLCFSLVGPTILHPVLFRFGTTKGRLVYLAIIACTPLYTNFHLESVFSATADLFSFLPGIVLVVVALYALSWRLSIHFYQKREL